MRNLKKVLSLTLALVMMLGMMVVGAGAAEYADAGDIEYKEAAEVMSAIGVFNGTDGNKFDPKGNLTRAQAAKIITYMVLGQTVADKLPNDNSKFSDCPNGEWYVGSVNYLSDTGIVAGQGDGTFNPNGNVTGVEFAKMLLGILGYDAVTEKFVNDPSWAANIAVKARQAGLDKDMTTQTVNSLALNRDQASMMAFNTLTATMVYYVGGTDVTTPDGTNIKVGGTVTPVANAAGDFEGSSYDDGYMQFCEQYYPNLKYDRTYTTDDDFGRPSAGQWLLSKEPVHTNYSDAAVVLKDATSDTELRKLLPRNVVLTGVEIKGNGNSDTAAAGTVTIKQIADLTAPGKKVEIYLNRDGDTVEKVITTTYTVETVDAITERSSGTTYRFSATGSKVNKADEDPVVIIEGSVEKDDVVTTVTANGKVYVYPTTNFTGSQTAKRTSSGVTTITVDGTNYTLASVTGFDATKFENSADEGTFYVDQFGFVVKAKPADAAPAQYAVIVNAIAQKTTTLDDVDGSVSVRAILADGTVADYNLALTKGDGTSSKPNTGHLYSGKVDVTGATVASFADNATMTNAVQNIVGKSAGTKLWGYTLNDDGQMVLQNVGEGMRTNNDAVKGKTYGATLNAYNATTSIRDNVDTDLDVLFNNSTVFVLYHTENGKYVTETVTGVGSLKLTAGSNGFAVVRANGAKSANASLVFLAGQAQAAEVDYVFIAKSSEKQILREGKNVYAYNGILPDPDAEPIEVWSATALDNTGVYVYNSDNKVTTMKLDTATAADPLSATQLFTKTNSAETATGSIKLGTGWYNTEDANVVYTSSSLEAVSGNKCFVVMQSNGANPPTKVATIYVYTDGTANVSATPTVGELEKILDDAADGATVTLPANTTLPSGTVDVPAGKTLVLPASTNVGSAVLNVASDSKVVVEGTSIPTFSGSGEVELNGDVTGTQLWPNGSNLAKLGMNKPTALNAANNNTPTTTGFAVSGVKLSGEGNVANWGKFGEFAENYGTDTVSLMWFNFGTTVLANGTEVKVNAYTAETATGTPHVIKGAGGVEILHTGTGAKEDFILAIGDNIKTVVFTFNPSGGDASDAFTYTFNVNR